jgi:hypothetical protein
MRLAPEASANVHDALDAVVRAAQAARQAPDTDTAKQALAQLWHDTHKAYEAITEAEHITRMSRLREIDRSAA